MVRALGYSGGPGSSQIKLLHPQGEASIEIISRRAREYVEGRLLR